MNQTGLSQTDPFYITGGNVPADALSYVTRDADALLLQRLLQGQFCYILTSRQMGKSSLMTQMVKQLREHNVAPAVLDLSNQGFNLDARQWYNGLLEQLGRRLKLDDEIEDFCLDHRSLSPLQLWQQALRDVVLEAMPDQQVVIFIDEIDVVRSLPFSTDEFFAAIRACYNARTEDPTFARLSFCLLGVATPADLISNPKLTPFNIGTRIELTDFSREEARSLEVGLGQDAAVNRVLMDRIYYWTSGHPYLTQRLCQAVAADDAHLTAGSVDACAARLFLSVKAQRQDSNLSFVQQRMLPMEEEQRVGLLTLYAKVLSGKSVLDSDTVAYVSELKLAGIVQAVSGRLAVRNRIYAQVFDRGWISENMPDAEMRRQRAAVAKARWQVGSIAAVILLFMSGLTGWAVRNSFLAERARNAESAAKKAYEVQLLEAKRQARIAHSASNKADKAFRNESTAKSAAQKSAAEANAQAKRAKESQAQALGALKRAEKFSYIGAINLAQREIEAGNFLHAEQLLEATRHSPERAFEWYYLNDLCHTELRRFSLAPSTSGQEQPGQRISMSPDGKRCLIIENGRVSLVDTETGRTVRKLGPDSATYVSFLPDGRRALIATEPGVSSDAPHGRGNIAAQPCLELWDTTAGTQLRRFPGSERFWTITTSRNGSVVAELENVTTGGKATGLVRLWEVDTGKIVKNIRVGQSISETNHFIGTSGLALSPDGRRIVIDYGIVYEPRTTCWDIRTGQMLWQIHSKADFNGTSMMFAPDGQSVIYTESPGNETTLFDAETGHVLPNWPQNGTSAAFSHRGDTIAAFCKGRILLYDPHTGKAHKELPYSENVVRLAFSPDDSQLVVGGTSGQITVFDLEIGKERLMLRGHSSQVAEIAIARNNRRIVSVAETVRLWYATCPRMGHIFKSASPRDSAKWVSFVPTTRISIMSGGDLAIRGADVSSTSMDSGDTIRSLRTFDRNLAVSRDGHWVASAEFAKNNNKSGEVLHLRCRAEGSRVAHDLILVGSWGEPNSLRQCSFTPDGHVVMATVPNERFGFSLYRWYTETGKPAAPPVPGVRALSPDGCFTIFDHAATLASKHTGKIDSVTVSRYETREIATGRTWQLSALDRLELAGSELMLSQDGKLLAYEECDSTITVRDGRTGSLVSRLLGQTGNVIHVVFSLDGQRLVTNSDDHTLRLWDTETGRILLTLSAYPYAAPIFSPDGLNLYELGTTGDLFVFRKVPGRAMAYEDLSSIADDILKTFTDIGDPAGALACAQRLLARDPTIKRAVAQQLNAAAWKVVDPDAKGKAAPDRIAAAIPAAERAVALSNHQDAAILDTLAAAYFANGDARRAAETEMAAIRLNTDPTNLAAFKKNLARYQGNAALPGPGPNSPTPSPALIPATRK
jgi:WD40 repeat protein